MITPIGLCCNNVKIYLLRVESKSSTVVILIAFLISCYYVRKVLSLWFNVCIGDYTTFNIKYCLSMKYFYALKGPGSYSVTVTHLWKYFIFVIRNNEGVLTTTKINLDLTLVSLYLST